MADYTIQITLAGRDQASQVVSQLNQQLGNLQQTQRATTADTRQTDSVFGGLGETVKGLIVGYGALRVAQTGLEMAALGDEVADTQAAFEALSGGAASYTANLEALRAGTRNTIDDLTLMQAGQKALSLGLVDTADEFQRMAENATGLGAFFGQMEGADALGRWTDMLANQTTRALRDFGIEQEKVKTRQAELMAEGLSSADAFRQAVEEQANAVKNRLGPAFEGAFDPIDKLTTRWENFWQAASVNVATGFEGILNFLDVLIQRMQDGEEAANDLERAMRLAFGLVGGTGEGAGGLQGAAQDVAAGLGTTSSRRRAEIEAMLARPGVNEMSPETQLLRMELAGLRTPGEEARGRAGLAALEAGTIGTEVNPELERAGMLMAELATDTQSLADAQSIELERMQRLTEQTGTATEAFDNLRQRMADLGLDEILGTGGGGREGEISDAVIEAMRAGGASEADIATMRTQLDLASGRETASSLAFQQQVAPMIAEMNPQEARRAIENINAFMTEAARLELTDEEIARGLPMAMGLGAGGGPGQSLTVRPGDTINALAAQLGIPPEQLMAQLGVTNPRLLQPGQYQIGGGVPGLMPGYGPDQAMFLAQQMAGGMIPGQKDVSDFFGGIGGTLSGLLTGGVGALLAAGPVGMDKVKDKDAIEAASQLGGDTREAAQAMDEFSDRAHDSWKELEQIHDRTNDIKAALLETTSHAYPIQVPLIFTADDSAVSAALRPIVEAIVRAMPESDPRTAPTVVSGRPS